MSVGMWWVAWILAGLAILVAPASLLWLAGVIDDPFVAVAVTMMWLLAVAVAIFVLAMESDQ